MSSATITLDQLSHGFKQANKDIDAHIAKVVKATAQKVVATQKANVPVGPKGSRFRHTRDLIRITAVNGGPVTKTTLVLEVGPKDPTSGKPWFIGRFIEYGTSRRAPHVFVANSVEPHRAAHERAILEATASGALAFLTR